MAVTGWSLGDGLLRLGGGAGAIPLTAMELVVPGIAGGLVLAVLWVRIVDPSWYPLGGVEALVYTFAAVTAFAVAVLAGFPSARRAAAVQPIVAIRTE
jgi:ABC-type antimicrobial peptide transport system permease subunit